MWTVFSTPTLYLCIFKILCFSLERIREKGREKSMRKKLIGQLPVTHHQMETWHTTLVYVLTRNQTADLLVQSRCSAC